MQMTRISVTRCIWIFLGVILSIDCLGLSIVSQTRTKLSYIDKAIQIYWLTHNGKLPDSLDALVEPDDPLLEKEILLDQWGEPIGYEREGNKYIVWSTGPDKKKGTDDDMIEGFRPLVESWKARHTQPVGGQGTNAVQQVTTGTVQPPVNGGTSPSQVKEGNMKKDGTVPPPSRLWLYVGIALCALVPFFYLLRRKLKTGNE